MSATSSRFASECLQAHNEKRKLHGVPKLKLNSELCVLAENWALNLIKGDKLAHSKHEYKGNPLGENIAGKTSTGAVTEYTGSEVVEQWYSEIKDYDFKGHTSGLKTGHFSQVVWKDSKEMGVGMATKGGKCIVVANYTPAGNYIGMYQDNVFPLASGQSVGSKVKALFKGKADKQGSDSSSSDDEAKSSHRDCKATPTKSYGTRTVTTTKTITKPDGSVEVITEEKVEKIENPSFNNNDSGKSVPYKPKQSASAFEKDALEAHNKWRAKHRVGKLKLNSELCKTAQKWAEHLASISTLKHSTNKFKGQPLGENVASKWGSAGADYTGEEVTKQWYDEEPTYDYSGRSNAGSAGHFSQVVWKGSEELGIGKAGDSKGRVFVVANYYPAGNYIGSFADNVFRP
ncbi:glipr2 [Bugula neritina]|uniref:Glipr2 n=1 Tax=Bugula neritina TaxID=10212 RepID=A0A7J7K7M2_BUGNE|nr:glipr2 [Bugula neritina]